MSSEEFVAGSTRPVLPASASSPNATNTISVAAAAAKTFGAARNPLPVASGLRWFTPARKAPHARSKPDSPQRTLPQASGETSEEIQDI